MEKSRALKQLRVLEKLNKKPRLAAEGWDKKWKILIAIILSARSRDERTIEVCENLFSKYDSLKKISNASVEDIENIIRKVNFYKTKSKNVNLCAKKIVDEFKGVVPENFDKLINLPWVGRKTANVFLAELGKQTIGVDTHITRISNKLNWTKSKNQKVIEHDLQELFPKKLWGEINYIVVGFGRSYPRKEQEKILDDLNIL